MLAAQPTGITHVQSLDLGPSTGSDPDPGDAPAAATRASNAARLESAAGATDASRASAF
jgi:hypothetical protein